MTLASSFNLTDSIVGSLLLLPLLLVLGVLVFRWVTAGHLGQVVLSRNAVAKSATSGHSARMTFSGFYATDLGSAHVGMLACPERLADAGSSGRPSLSNQARRDRKPLSA